MYNRTYKIHVQSVSLYFPRSSLDMNGYFINETDLKGGGGGNDPQLLCTGRLLSETAG